MSDYRKDHVFICPRCGLKWRTTDITPKLHLLHIGEVVEVYADKGCITDGKPDVTKVNPILLAQATYFDIGKHVEKVFSAGKKYRKK